MTEGRLTLQVSLGPVQGFIAQSRRTRDLWAGSFLLSWLSGVAMRAVKDRHGQILVPSVENDAMFRAIGGHQPVDGTRHEGSPVGTLPNRFTAAVPADFDPEIVGRSVEDAWCALAAAVLGRFLEPVLKNGGESEAIWNRQIEGFWQVTWILSESDDRTLLKARKQWRFPRSAAEKDGEGGDHCHMMGDYQELSGWVRARGEARKQDEFWDEVRKKINRTIYGEEKAAGSLELGRSERLCAIALVKRLYPLLPPEEIDRLTDDIVAALKTVYDPEIPADIYELGLIYRVEISDERKVSIDMTLTSPGCPVAGEMPGWVENAVATVQGVQEVAVDIVFDPPWDQSRMSDEARVALDMW